MNNSITSRIKLVHFFIWAIAACIIAYEIFSITWISGPNYGIFSNTGGSQGIIVDFPFHFNFIKTFWQNYINLSANYSVYSIQNHLISTNNWLGIDIKHSLPFGYSPTMFILFAPLVFYSHLVAYYFINLLGLFLVWWQTKPNRCRLGLGLLPFCSPLAFSCFCLGQTAVMTSAGLLYIFEKTRNQVSSVNSKSAIIPGVVLWALTAKPPLALTAGCILIGLRCWRPLLIAASLTTFTTILLSPLLGPDWVSDYIVLLQKYNKVDAGPIFAWSIWPSHMANLRGVLNVDFGIADDIASRISSTVWVLTLSVFSVVGIKSRLAQGEFWSIGILLYLLFCPHVSSTEELQTALLIPLCVSPDKKKLSIRELFLLASVPLLVLASPAVGPFFLNNRIALFSAKLFLIIFLLAKKPLSTDKAAE